MAARLINGIQYIELHDDNSLKSKSLECNIYFTLRDIWLNAENMDDVFEADSFNKILVDNVSYENRKLGIIHSNILYDNNSNYLKELYEWFARLDGRLDRKKYKTIDYIRSLFTFETPNEDEEINMNKYMRADEWWAQMVDLIDQLEKLSEKHKKLKAN